MRLRQFTLIHSPAWKTQSARGVRLDNAELTAAFPASELSFREIVKTKRDVLRGDGQKLLKRKVTARYFKQQVRFELRIAEMAGLMAFARGSAAIGAVSGGLYPHTITDTPGLTLPLTTIAVAFRDNDDADPEVIKDCFITEVKFEGKVGDLYMVDATIIGSADIVEDATLAIPAFSNSEPMGSEDGFHFEIDGVDYTHLVRSFKKNFSNDVDLSPDGHLFAFNSVDISGQAERADMRPETLEVVLFSHPGHELFVMGDNDMEIASAKLRIGPAAGERYEEVFGASLVEMQGLDGQGQNKDTAVTLVITPLDSSVVATAHTSLATALLTADVAP